MEIRLRLAHKKSASQLRDLLLKKLKRSRFEVRPHNVTHYMAGNHCRYGKLRIFEVRLKERKRYHGANPTAHREMRRRGWGKGPYKPAKMSFLEGADWVEFNDLLNDFCDELGICADIFSAVCVIRRGWFRRVIYKSEIQQGHVIWERFPSPDHFMGVMSPNGPFPMSSFYATDSNSVHLSPAGIYRNLYVRWSPRMEDCMTEEFLTSLIESGEITRL